MEKTIEQLLKEKRILEQEINGCINKFREENPNIEFACEFAEQRISLNGAFPYTISGEMKVKLTL